MELGDIEHRIRSIEKAAEIADRWRPEAGLLLQKAEAATLSLFRFDEMRIVHRDLTVESERGDVIKVQWETRNGTTTGHLALRDTSEASVYSIRLRSLNAVDFAAKLPQLVAFPKLNVSILLEESESKPGQAQFGFQIQGGSRPLVHDYRLQGALRNGDWFLELVVGKGRLVEFYGRGLDVRERAPALEDLVRNWSEDSISTGLAKQSYPHDGESILVRELVRRGTSDRVLLELMGPQTEEAVESAVSRSVTSGWKGKRLHCSNADTSVGLPSISWGDAESRIKHTSCSLICLHWTGLMPTASRP